MGGGIGGIVQPVAETFVMVVAIMTRIMEQIVIVMPVAEQVIMVEVVIVMAVAVATAVMTVVIAVNAAVQSYLAVVVPAQRLLVLPPVVTMMEVILRDDL